MSDLSFSEMQSMQKELQKKYEKSWGGLSPDMAMRQMLWMYTEMGEAVSVMQKNGSERIMTDKTVRDDFIEEMCDVIMYINDILLCYDISPEELGEIYTRKHLRNMTRW